LTDWQRWRRRAAQVWLDWFAMQPYVWIRDPDGCERLRRVRRTLFSQRFVPTAPDGSAFTIAQVWHLTVSYDRRSRGIIARGGALHLRLNGRTWRIANERALELVHHLRTS
jgi:hypothetical protein